MISPFFPATVPNAILGRLGNDLDFTTDAHPKDSEKILKKWADSVWDIGAAFGTVAGKKDEITVEITTYRSESYDPASRKPDVEFGNTQGAQGLRQYPCDMTPADNAGGNQDLGSTRKGAQNSSSGKPAKKHNSPNRKNNKGNQVRTLFEFE